MKKHNLYLIVAFAVQLGLGAITWNTCNSEPEQTIEKKLINLNLGDITGLKILEKPGENDFEAKQVNFEKKGDKWVAVDIEDFPVLTDKVNEVLDKLLALKVGAPIATSSADHNALKVGDREYGRNIELKTASKTVSLIIGDGMGQTIQVRFADKNDVYQARGMSMWTASTRFSGYIDAKYIDIDKDKLTSAMIVNSKGPMTFTKEGETWVMAETPKGSELNQDEVKTLMGKLSKLTAVDPIGREIKPEYGLTPGVRVELTYTEDNEPKFAKYTIGAPKGDNHFYIKADEKDFVVTVTKYGTEYAREKASADFVKKDEKTEADATGKKTLPNAKPAAKQ